MLEDWNKHLLQAFRSSAFLTLIQEWIHSQTYLLAYLRSPIIAASIQLYRTRLTYTHNIQAQECTLNESEWIEWAGTHCCVVPRQGTRAAIKYISIYMITLIRCCGMRFSETIRFVRRSRYVSWHFSSIEVARFKTLVLSIFDRFSYYHSFETEPTDKPFMHSSGIWMNYLS